MYDKVHIIFKRLPLKEYKKFSSYERVFIVSVE